MDYATMTLEDLEAENQRLGAEQDKIKAEREEIRRHMDQKVHERNAKAKLASLSEDEVKALGEMLQAKAEAKQE